MNYILFRIGSSLCHSKVIHVYFKQVSLSFTLATSHPPPGQHSAYATGEIRENSLKEISIIYQLLYII